MEDKIACVTGATTGIGLAIARRLSAAGASVIVVARSGDEVRIAAELGEKAAPAHADLLFPEEIRSLFKMISAKYGRLDILVNNAGSSVEQTTLLDASEENIDKILHLNTRAVLLASKYAIPLMLNAQGGSIINISSTTGLRSEPLLTAYAAAKAGVVGFTYTLARELGRHGIRVNTICPGPINTPLFRSHVSEEASKRLAERTAIGRVGRPDEVAAVAHFLASEDASFVTGTCIPVDGGFIC